MDETLSISAETQRRIDSAQSGATRAAVLGISDGLVTNVSLILGVAAASVDAGVVRIAGLASLAAGACSMAVGEYVSMRAQVELLEGVLAKEHEAMDRNAEGELQTLVEIMQRDGIDPATARTAGREVMRDRRNALRFYARAVLGFNEEELGSPYTAAWSSLAMFAIGAAVPLVPWFLTTGGVATIASVVLAAIAALIIGGVLGVVSGKPIARTALRQLIVLILAAGVTYLVGRLFKVSVS